MHSLKKRFCSVLLALLFSAIPALAQVLSSSPEAGITSSNGKTGPAFSADNPPSTLAVDGFFASAFSSEYADDNRSILIRWASPLKIYLKGSPTEDDQKVLRSFLYDLQENVAGLPPISILDSQENATVVIAFVPYKQMSENLITYNPDNWGFMNCFDENGEIRYGLIAIATDVTQQPDRNHLIQEEFVNMLGLTDDLGFAPDSIIYQPYTKTQTLSKMDMKC